MLPIFTHVRLILQGDQRAGNRWLEWLEPSPITKLLNHATWSFIQPHQAQCKAFENWKSHWMSSGCRSAISHVKENACFCGRVIEIGGKLFIHDLVQTSVIKYEYEIKKSKTYENIWKLTWVLPFQRDTGSCFAVVFQHGPTSLQGDKLHEDTWLPSNCSWGAWWCMVFLQHTTLYKY